MSKRVEMIGRKFGRLTVLELSENRGNRGQLKYKCICDCGTIVEVMGEALRKLRVQSCGCLSRERAREVNQTHGGSKERLYKVWMSMKKRCYNKNEPLYKNYGGRGITVCEEWKDYAKFREFMLSNGYDPEAPRGNCTLDRIDVNGNYEPNNCRIIPMSEQYFNRTDSHLITYDGVTKTVTEWAQDLGVKMEVILHRLKRGWSVEDALTTPKRVTKKYEYKGELHTMREWAEIFDVEWWRIRNQLLRKCSTMEEVVENLDIKF